MTPSAFKELEGNEEHHYLSLFDNHPKGEGVLIGRRSILKLKIEREEMSWADVWLEAVAFDPIFKAWSKKILVIVGTSKKLNDAGVRLSIIYKAYS